MRIGIHQPEHLPWLGFFDRIKNVDAFVLLDHVNFSKNNFQNRNRIRSKNKQTWEWLTVPVSMDGEKAINKVKLMPRETWQKSYLEKIRHNYCKDKYFTEIWCVINEYLDLDTDLLFDINKFFISKTLQFLDIKTAVFQSSKMQLTKSKSSMLVEICQKIGGTEYVTGVGALDYLDKSEFEKHGISIIIRDPKKALTEYSCEEQRLSAIDALMKNGKNLKSKIENLPVNEIRY